MSDAPAPAISGQTTRPKAKTTARTATAEPSGASPSSAAPPGAQTGTGQLLAELKVSGHLMTLEDGLYCIVQTPAKGAVPGSGLPGVRLSLPPGSASRPDAVSITAFRPDGWLAASGDAALVRISGGPAQLLVTIYQAPSPQEGGAPNIQVMRLLEGAAAPPGGPAAGRQQAPAPLRTVAEPGRAAAAARVPAVMEMVAHIQERGDVGAMLGEWLGERGSRRWIEGFGLSPTSAISPKDIEYQGVLGQGWLSPWVEGGQFCGSRAMALPLLGLRVRLRGAAADAHDVVYSASFIDGSAVGPVMNGEACEADSLAAMEAFQIIVRPRAAAAPADKPARGKSRATSPAPEPPPAPEPVRAASKQKAKAKAKPPSGRKR